MEGENREYLDVFCRGLRGNIEYFPIKHRRKTTDEQRNVLEKIFRTNPRPDTNFRRVLAQELGMDSRRVQVWFQNRRAKEKKMHATKSSYRRHHTEAANPGIFCEISGISVKATNNSLFDPPTAPLLNEINNYFLEEENFFYDTRSHGLQDTEPLFRTSCLGADQRTVLFGMHTDKRIERSLSYCE